MPKYLFEASYTREGLQGLLSEGGTQRREAVENLATALGGSIEAFYYAFGDCDIYVIADLPDDATATAASLVVGASGAGSVKTTVLIPPETVDEATGKAVDYRPPTS